LGERGPGLIMGIFAPLSTANADIRFGDPAIWCRVAGDARVKPAHDAVSYAELSACITSALDRTSETRGSVFSIANWCNSGMLLQASSATMTV